MDGKISDDSQGEGANERLYALNFTVGKISAVSEFRTQISSSAGQCLTDPQGLLNCLESLRKVTGSKFISFHQPACMKVQRAMVVSLTSAFVVPCASHFHV